jgi:hypothetical protein
MVGMDGWIPHSATHASLRQRHDRSFTMGLIFCFSPIPLLLFFYSSYFLFLRSK